MSAALQDAFAHAQRHAAAARAFRGARLRALEAGLPGAAGDHTGPKIQSGLYARSASEWRHHIGALLRMRPGDANGAARLVPRFADMDSATWVRAEGPHHVCVLAAAYGLSHPDLVDPRALAALRHHVHLEYGGRAAAHHGNLLLAGSHMASVALRTSGSSPGALHSLLLADVDVPCAALRQRIALVLWAALNVRGTSGAPLSLSAKLADTLPGSGLTQPSASDDSHGASLHDCPTGADGAMPPEGVPSGIDAHSENTLPYLPPHPARGSDMHRVVALMLQHSEPLHMRDIADAELSARLQAGDIPALYRGRATSAKHIVGMRGASLVGLQFHRTPWTLPVSDAYARLGLHEPVFGEVVELEKHRNS